MADSVCEDPIFARGYVLGLTHSARHRLAVSYGYLP
jgi:hypothetical protein